MIPPVTPNTPPAALTRAIPSTGTKRAADEEATLLRDMEDLDISAAARPRLVRTQRFSEDEILNWMSSQEAAKDSPLSSSSNLSLAPPKLAPRRVLRAARVYSSADSASFTRPLSCARNLYPTFIAMEKKENESREDACLMKLDKLNLND